MGELMNLKTFILSFVFVYVIISLPAIVGIGYEIDWVSEATFLDKLKGYVLDGLITDFFVKSVMSILIGFIISLVISMRRQ